MLQSGEYSRVGETKARRSDVRIIAATNRDLHKMMLEKTFREDFYYRINNFEIQLPPLRKRKQDIMLYFEMLIKKFATEMKKSIPTIEAGVEEILTSYHWLGNIRELKNVAERTSILYDSKSGVITSDLIPDRLLWDGTVPVEEIPGQNFKAVKEEVIQKFEVNFITQHLRNQHGNVAATAREIGVHPVFLRQNISALGIDPKAIKSQHAEA